MATKPDTDTKRERALGPIHLRFGDGDRAVVVHPRDQDRFWLTSHQAADACVAAVRSEERFQTYWHQMLRHLHQRVVEKADTIAACFVSMHEGAITAFIVPRSGEFDLDVGTYVAVLYREFRKTFSFWPWQFLMIPAMDRDSLTAFFDPHSAMQVYPAESK